ncbi:MAG: hypothetical protein ABL865_03365 [Candidatus Nitrotoga sp.]
MWICAILALWEAPIDLPIRRVVTLHGKDLQNVIVPLWGATMCD